MATNISDFKNLIAVDVLPCPDPIVNREVVSTILDFCQHTYILQRDFQIDISAETPATPQDYVDVDVSTETTSLLRPFSVMEIMVDGVKYVPRRRKIVTDITTYFDYTQEDVNHKFFNIEDEDTIRVFDMDDDDTYIWFNVALKPLRTATTVDDILFEDHSEAIVAGAKSKILMMPNKDWTDLEAAAIYRAEYKKYLSRAKAMVLKGQSGGYGERANWQSFED